MSKKKDDNFSPRINNRKAFHDYHISEKLEVGIVLVGSEVKSIRQAKANLADGFARVEADGQLYLYNIDIQPYAQSAGTLGAGHLPKTRRKLLAKKRQIEKLATLTASKGVTLIPLAMYFVRGFVKVELGVGQGKQAHDKRQTLKERESKRELSRIMSHKGR
jgi:SsrA-binding protein